MGAFEETTLQTTPVLITQRHKFLRPRSIGYVSISHFLSPQKTVPVPVAAHSPKRTRRSSTARLLWLRVRIPPWVWMFVCC